MKRRSKVTTRLQSVLDPTLEKPLLHLHAAIDVDSFWKGVQDVITLEAADSAPSKPSRSVSVSENQYWMSALSCWRRKSPGPRNFSPRRHSSSILALALSGSRITVQGGSYAILARQLPYFGSIQSLYSRAAFLF